MIRSIFPTKPPREKFDRKLDQILRGQQEIMADLTTLTADCRSRNHQSTNPPISLLLALTQRLTPLEPIRLALAALARNWNPTPAALAAAVTANTLAARWRNWSNRQRASASAAGRADDLPRSNQSAGHGCREHPAHHHWRNRVYLCDRPSCWRDFYRLGHPGRWNRCCWSHRRHVLRFLHASR